MKDTMTEREQFEAAMREHLAEVCEAGEAFINRVNILSKKIDSVTMIAEMHGCNPFGEGDDWCKEYEGLRAAIAAARRILAALGEK